MNIVLSIAIILSLLIIGFITLFKFKANQKINVNIINYVLISLVLIFYILTIISKVVILKYDFNGIIYALPFRNISPTAFCCCILVFFLRGKALNICKSIYSYLSIALIIAGFICPATLPISYNISYVPIDIFSSSLSHIFAGLLGFWFVWSRQIVLDKSSLKSALIIIYSLIVFSLILNAIFKINLLGLGMFANYSIYDLVRVEPYILTLLIFVVGVTLIIVMSHLLFKIPVSRNKTK